MKFQKKTCWSLHRISRAQDQQGRRATYITEEKPKVFPNPANDKIYLMVRLNENETGKVEIFDRIGHIIFHYDLAELSNGLAIDVREFTDGLYFIKFATSNGYTFADKFTIIKQQ